MLPSHLLDTTKKKNERLSHTRLGHAPPPPPPSLCVTGAMSQIGRYRIINKTGNQERFDNAGCDGNNDAPIILSYCIFRPRQLHDKDRPPLLCLHGGPSIPSNYLLPIVNGVTDRAVIFYDQWGCGKSSRPQPKTETNSTKKKPFDLMYPPFSIPVMVEHLRQLIEEHWKLKRFHLFGHSFGGILAYEYLLNKMKDEVETKSSSVCSLILSSTPTSAALIQSESERLFENLMDSLGRNKDMDNGDESIQQKERKKERLRRSMMQSEDFRQTHECRLPHAPLALLDALAQMGPVPWRGMPAIDGYEARGGIKGIPTLLLRGEYDLCAEKCMEAWIEKLGDGNDGLVQQKVLPNCSHYAMLEDEKLYGAELLRYIKSYDGDDLCS